VSVLQAEEKSAERDAAKSQAAEYSILLERTKVMEVSARDEIRNQTKVCVALRCHRISWRFLSCANAHHSAHQQGKMGL
jgi:hypothetical protein